jgi:hypothetical protein
LKVFKAGASGARSGDAGGELEAINAFAKTELKQEQVYVFSVVLCTNEIDRDFEKFSEEALAQLAELFVGKTGIFDHEWKAANQTARIYRTELVREKGVYNAAGEPLVQLKGHAYMLRSEKNAGLIEEIEAGIKKETSVGCSVTRRLCSVCGCEQGAEGCGHIPGGEYEGRLCYIELFDAADAYEWSFVAVPAQKGAGVVKRFGERAQTLKDFVDSKAGAAFAPEYEALVKDAVLGREYRDALRSEVLRLALLADKSVYKALTESTKALGAAELLSLKEHFTRQTMKMFPPRTQLPGRGETTSFDGDVYRV